MTPESIARAMLFCLIEDEEWSTPEGTKGYRYFQGMEIMDAARAYRQIEQLPEGMRMRDLMERMEGSGSQ